MSSLEFLAPYRLLLLLGVLALVGSYVWLHRRRPVYSARFP